MLIGRREFLRQLESCAPGTSTTSDIEHADCFVIHNGKITTFNDEIRCIQDTELPYSCVVPARPLLETLRKLTEDDIEVKVTESKLSIICPGLRKIHIKVAAEAFRHGTVVEEPDEWRDVVPAFADGLAMVGDVASKDEENILSCVHIRQKGLEATDGFQAIRYRVDSPFTSTFLVKKTAAQAIKGMGIAAMAETPSWLHWKTYTGLIISVRRYSEDYPDLNQFFGATPQVSLKMPPALVESLQQAALFLPETEAGRLATFKLSAGKLHISGMNETGSYEEQRNVDYDGPDMIFGMCPKYIENILKHDYPCLFTESTLRVKGDSFVYVTAKETVE